MRKFLAMLFSLLLVLAGMTPVAAAARPAASVAGVVTGPTGQPVAGAEVEVYKLGGGLVTVLTSDESGSFKLSQSVDESALWQLRVVADGFRTLESGWQDLAAHPYQPLKLEPLLGALQVAVRDTRGAVLDGMVLLTGPDGQLVGEFSLQAGSMRKTGLTAGSYRAIVTASGYAPAAGSIAVVPDKTSTLHLNLEKVGLVLSGEVLDAVSGLPLPGATVEALRDDQIQAAMGRADDQGRFRLGLPDGMPADYRLRVSAAGHRMTLTSPATLAAGQERDWSGDDAIALQPLTGDLAGTLVSQYGAAVPQATVLLQLKGYGEVAETKTDDNGDFQFNAVATATGSLYRVSFRDANAHIDSEWQELKAGSKTELVLRVQPEYNMTFGLGKLSGVITTPAGAPVAGAKVELLRSGTATHTAETGADGSFTLADLPGTRAVQGFATVPYAVRISKDGYVPTREFTVDGAAATDLTIAPQTRTIIRAVLSPATAVLHGRVMEADGHPVALGQVELLTDGGIEHWTATTDAAGWYDLRNVALKPAGRYLLKVTAAGYLTPGRQDVSTSVAGGKPLPTLRLTPETADFAGQVSGPDGAPVAGATIQLRGLDGKPLATAQTDDAGIYRLKARVAKTGLLTLTAGRDGWSTAVAEVAAPPAPGATLSKDLVILPNTAALEGRVLDEDNQARRGVGVELVAEGRGVVATAVTDEQGRYRFADVASGGSGWYWLRARATGAAFAGSLTHQTDLVPMLRLTAGETTVVDLLVR